MQSHERKAIDVRALKWLDGEMDHLERFKVERWDGRGWTPVTE